MLQAGPADNHAPRTSGVSADDILAKETSLPMRRQPPAFPVLMKPFTATG